MYVNGNSRTVLDSARTRKREESFEKVFNLHTVRRSPIYAVSRQKENGNTTVDESNCEKHYVLLFTYAPTRAVHLELTRGVSMPGFLLAFRRFASRRVLPATLLSDNAKTFRATDKELQRIVPSQEVQQVLAEKRITWKFIVERAPWWGGFWEKLIRSVK